MTSLKVYRSTLLMEYDFLHLPPEICPILLSFSLLSSGSSDYSSAELVATNWPDLG